MKTVFVGHPIGGDVKGNVEKVVKICSALHTKQLIPVAPYLVSLQYLNDEVFEDRELGVDANFECFRRGYIDELWLFGNKISEGMKKEIDLAIDLNIPVIPQTQETNDDFRRLYLKN